jgi:hypothetical protein
VLLNVQSVFWYVYHHGLLADISITHPTSTRPDAVNNQSVPNALSRSNEANRQSHTLNLNLPPAHSASKQISESFTNDPRQLLHLRCLLLSPLRQMPEVLRVSHRQ